MQNIILFDDMDIREHLLPISFTRPLANIRIGINTIREKWEYYLHGNYSYITADYLADKFYPNIEEDTLYITSNVCPNELSVKHIKKLKCGEALTINNKLLAFRGSYSDFTRRNFAETSNIDDDSIISINKLYDIFMLNDRAIHEDFLRISAHGKSQVLSSSNNIIGNPNFEDGTPKIYIEHGAKVEFTTLNVTNGPIYIGADAEIMEGTCIRAPFAACEHAIVNMGSKIYGATTLGPYCKVGGEVNNVVMIGYSNKGHDGFLGNAVIGEWCNIGAGTNASNLKNDYSEIKLWDYAEHRFLRTGLQFCGLIMGDHSKAGINCMFNTATVVGVGVNIYGAGYPRNFVASFSEGSTAGFNDVSLNRFFSIAQKMMARRGIELTETDRKIFEKIFEIAERYK